MDYYDRGSHESSMVAMLIAIFATFGGLMLGGLVSLFSSGFWVWLATAIGMIFGVMTFSLCYIAGESDRRSNEIKK